MDRFFAFILNHKKTVLFVFCSLLVLSVIGFTMVNMNSDVTSYLGDDTDTRIGKEKLASEFDIIGDGAIGISNVDRSYVDDVVSKLEEYDIIKKVAYIGSFDAMLEEINNPNNSQGLIDELTASYSVVQKKFYKAETDTYIISFYLNVITGDERSIDLINDLEAYVNATIPEGGEFALNGSATNARDLLDSSLGEMPKYLLVAVLAVLIVLLLFSKSFFEPVILLVTLGISVILNLGSNVILGSVSSITFSASAILQLALSMDYAIFLMHTFYEEKAKSLDTKTALRAALPKTLKAVAASAITTVGGFVALFSMRYGIGYDLGIVLAKGVLLSLMTIVILQPILMLLASKVVDKTKHKELKPSFKLMTYISTKGYKVIIVIALLLVLPTFIMQFNVDLNYLSVKEDNPNLTTTEQIMKEDSNQIILIVPYTKGTTNSKHYVFYDQVKSIENVDEIFSITSIVSEHLLLGAMLTGNELVTVLEDSLASDNYCLYTFSLKSDIESVESYNTIDEIKRLSNENFNEYYVTGLAQGAYDLATVTPSDFARVSLLSAIIIFIILFITFKSFSLAAVLVLIIELGIWINLSIVSLTCTSINFMSYIIISAIQLGATVDYAIILASKYEENKKTMSKEEAIKSAIRRAGPSVLTSALVLIVGCFSVNMVTTNVIVGEITLLIARGAMFSLLLVFTLLPAILTFDSKSKIIVPKEKNKTLYKKS